MVFGIETVLLLGLVSPCGADTPPKPPAVKTARGKFTVGKDTTYVTGPVDKDGYLDYPAALNERLGKGVTAENNAVALLWAALGPHPEGATMPAEFFRLLGIAQPPETGDYFVPLSRYMKDTLRLQPGPATAEIEEQLGRATRRPWAGNDFPALAGWLKANERPVAVAIEATRRSNYFSPLVSRSGLIGALLPAIQKSRELTTALSARAMLRAGSGAADAAWQDLLACHRLGRLVGRGGTLIEGLVGVAIDQIAFKADLAFLDRTKPNAKQIEQYINDLRKLPPLVEMADKVDLCERFTCLEAIALIDRHGLKYLDGLTNGKTKVPDAVRNLVLDGIDWDPALKNINGLYDRMVAAMRTSDRTARQKALDEIEAAIKDNKKRLIEGGELANLMVGDARERGKVLGDVLTGLLLPAVSKVQSAADRARVVHDNVLMAFALEWYHRDHNRYPEQLDALSPKYLAKVSLDLFSGKPLVYRISQQGYLLYSVGANGQDDGGRGVDDERPADDLTVRVPPPALKR